MTSQPGVYCLTTGAGRVTFLHSTTQPLRSANTRLQQICNKGLNASGRESDCLSSVESGADTHQTPVLIQSVRALQLLCQFLSPGFRKLNRLASQTPTASGQSQLGSAQLVVSKATNSPDSSLIYVCVSPHSSQLKSWMCRTARQGQATWRGGHLTSPKNSVALYLRFWF